MMSRRVTRSLVYTVWIVASAFGSQHGNSVRDTLLVTLSILVVVVVVVVVLVVVVVVVTLVLVVVRWRWW